MIRSQRKKGSSPREIRIPAIVILLLIFCYHGLFGQGYFLEKNESGVIGSLNAYLDQNIYGFGVSAGVAPREFININLSLGKIFHRDDEYSSQLVSPKLTIYPMRMFYEYPLSFSLFAAYQVEQFDFESAKSMLLFEKSEKVKTKTFGGSLYYSVDINSEFKFVPEIGLMKSYRKFSKSSIEKNESATDLSDLYEFLFQTRSDNFIEWIFGINLSQELAKKHRLFLLLDGRYNNTTLRSQFTIGMIF